MASGIEFYYMPESPPCRMVEMVASLLGVQLNKHYLNLFLKENLKEDFIKLNPRHKVPFLVDGELKINESRAIMAYLVNKYKPDSALYPKDPVAKARVDELLFYDIGTLYPATSKLFGPKLFGDANAPLNQDDEKAFRDTLSYLDQRLTGNKFLLGDALNIADIAISTTITFATVGCQYNIGEFKNLVEYLKNIRNAIPSYAEINDGPSENMRKFIQSRREEATK